MMPRAFDSGTIGRLATEEEVDIETSPAAGRSTRRVTIWIVVVGDEVYVRSVRGPTGRWYRDLQRNPRGILHVGSQALAVRAVPVGDPDTISAVSDAYLRKYAASPHAPPMVRDEVLPTTLRLEPA
jgi:hypothetical protein